MHRWLALALLILPLPDSPHADATEERGLSIAVEMEHRDAGWGDVQSDMRMVLRNLDGGESLRRLRSSWLEVADDGDKGLTIFDSPADVKGSAFLSFTHPTRPDDQWLFLPALKRVKRITSAHKSGPFMGSEFAFEDMSSQEVEKYRYRWLRDEPANGAPAFVLERYPRYPYSGYHRQVVWVDQAIYRPVKVEFYDRKDQLLKTLTYHDYQLYLERFWRASRLQMVNHQTGKSTELVFDHYRFGVGLSERDFDRNSLKRVR